MIESIMYFGIGFLFATLIGVAVIPLIHSRAVRLTIRRLQDSIPQSMAEIQGDKDALRAEFAMSTRRLERSVEQLKNKTADQLAQLGQKGDAINRLKIERDAQKVEVVALKTEVEALKERLTAAGEEVEVAEGRRHADDVVSLVPRAWPTAELVSVPMDSLQGLPVNDQRRADDVISLVPKEWPTAEEARSGGPARDPDAGRDSSDQRIGLAREESEFSAGLQAAESSIHISARPSDFKNDQFASDRPSIGIPTSSSLARFFVAALIGVGATFAWQYQGDKAKDMVRTWVPSLGSLLSVSTTKSPLDVDIAAKQPGSTSAHQVSAQDAGLPQPTPIIPTPPAPAAAAISPEHSAEPLTAKQEQLSDELQAVEQDIKQKTPSAPLQNSPQSKPTPLEGWTLREVTNGTAVLEGPTGIWRVTPGDTLPGVGKVESYIRSNGQWVVATSRGLISMPVRQNTSSPPLQSDTKFTPTPETNPKTIEGWTLREVTNGTAVLQGPTGILRVTLGDTVVGLGKVTAIVRWGKGWVVATSAGYCTSAPPEHADGICKPYSGPH